MEISEHIEAKWTPDLIDKFKSSAEKIDARVHKMAGITELISIAAEYAKLYSAKVCLEPNLDSVALPLKGIETSKNPLDCDISITQALFGIADTGSIVMDTTDENLRKQTALVKAHLVILNPKLIVPTLYDAFEIIDELSSEKDKFNYSIITGPSRTADIERVLTLGVHGPEKLDIFMWDESYEK